MSADAAVVEACRAFAIEGELESIRPFGNGHIHATFLTTFVSAAGRRSFVHQRLNGAVFRDPEGLMGNLARILDHLDRKLRESGADDADRRRLRLVPTRDGRPWWRDPEGKVWRTTLLVPGTSSHDLPRSPRDVYQAAHAYGAFQRHLLDLPAPPLVETIPAFHDTEARLEALRRAVARDAAGRASGAAAEIAFVERNADLAPALARLERAGAIRSRTVHNDTKLNNVLLDDATGEGLCVIDLDTTMPGIALADFGDLARSATSAAAEDDPDPARAVVVPELFVAAACGFLAALGDLLTGAERDSLVLAARVLTYECGVRFLTDHLDGDRYFRVARPDHNLQRCRTQFALVESLASREDELLRRIDDARRRG
jgi:hypothetical protein